MRQLKKSIVLVGMTGVGKTTIGKILAREMKINFFDIDQEIEKITNLKIKDFFKMYGEQEFRRIEKSTLLGLIKRNEKNIIAPGAGIFSDNEIREKLNNDCICVFLNIHLNILTLRLKKNLSNRPKLSKGKLEDNLKEMYIKRFKDYEKSHITIDVNEISIPDVVSRINKALINYEKFNKL
jgi:shikimate kinase